MNIYFLVTLETVAKKFFIPGVLFFFILGSSLSDELFFAVLLGLFLFFVSSPSDKLPSLFD